MTNVPCENSLFQDRISSEKTNKLPHDHHKLYKTDEKQRYQSDYNKTDRQTDEIQMRQ